MRYGLTVIVLVLCALGAWWWPHRTGRGGLHSRDNARANSRVSRAIAPEPEASPKVLADEPSPHADDHEPLAQLVQAVETLDTGEIREQLDLLPLDQLRGEAGRQLALRWAQLDPVAAGAWAVCLPDAQACSELSTVIALAWWERDADRALSWVVNLSEGETRHRVVAEIGVEVAREDPSLAVSLAGVLPPGAARDGLLLHALRQWSNQDPERAGFWAVRLPDGAFRQQALGAVAVAMAERDAKHAAIFLTQHTRPGREQSSAALGISERWRQSDPLSAEKWMRMLRMSAHE